MKTFNVKKLAALFLSFCTFLNFFVFTVLAEDTNEANEKTELNIEVKMDGSLNNVPLSLKTEKGRFFFAKNVGPGDELSSQIIFKNTEKVTVQVAVLNIDDDSVLKGSLGDEVNLEVLLGKDLIYKGPYSKITDPLTNWIPVKPGESLIMDLYINIPKEADNRFQGAKIDATWNFGVRSNVLNGVKAKIVFKDGSEKIVEVQEKEFDYDHLVTDQEINVPEGFRIIKFTPKKVNRDGDEVEVYIKAIKDGEKTENIHKVTFIYKDESEKIIKTIIKTFPNGHKITASDLDDLDGYINLTFSEKIIEKDDEINVLVKKQSEKESVNNDSKQNNDDNNDKVKDNAASPEKVKTGDSQLFGIGLIFIGLSVLILLMKLFKQKEK